MQSNINYLGESLNKILTDLKKEQDRLKQELGKHNPSLVSEFDSLINGLFTKEKNKDDVDKFLEVIKSTLK